MFIHKLDELLTFPKADLGSLHFSLLRHTIELEGIDQICIIVNVDDTEFKWDWSTADGTPNETSFNIEDVIKYIETLL